MGGKFRTETNEGFRHMTKILKLTGLAIAAVFLGMQFFRPDRTNPPVDDGRTLYARLSVPDDVRSILDRSCMDCHSNTTRWPWYSNIAPASWIVAGDVNEARKQLNLSDFAQYKSLRAVGRLDMMCENMQDGIMPLPKYVIMHPDARLSPEEINRFCDWVESVRDSLASEE